MRLCALPAKEPFALYDPHIYDLLAQAGFEPANETPLFRFCLCLSSPLISVYQFRHCAVSSGIPPLRTFRARLRCHFCRCTLDRLCPSEGYVRRFNRPAVSDTVRARLTGIVSALRLSVLFLRLWTAVKAGFLRFVLLTDTALLYTQKVWHVASYILVTKTISFQAPTTPTADIINSAARIA